MSTPPELEQRLRAALSARAEQVQPEDVSQVAPVVPLRRRRNALVIVLASAACAAIVVGVLFRVVDTNPRTDPAPQPNTPDLVLPPDVGRDWKADDLSTPARLDLDGDGTLEKVHFLAEPSKDFDGRTRLQTRLSSTGEEAYGMAQLATTIGTTALDPIDADGDGDQELVLYREDLDGGPGAPVVPLVFDLRDGLLVEAPSSDPGLLLMGDVPVPDESTAFYDMVRVHDYWIEDETLFSSRSVSTFAAMSMSLFKPATIVMDAYVWRLGEDGVLRPEEADVACVRQGDQKRRPCSVGEEDSLPEVGPVADDRVSIDGSFTSREGYRFRASLEPATDPDSDADLVVSSEGGRILRQPLFIGAEPRLFTTAVTGVFFDGASVLVASEDGDEPGFMQVLVQGREEMRPLEQVGDVPLGTGHTEDARRFRTWLTSSGSLLTAVAETGDDSGAWTVHRWSMVDGDSMVAVPLDTMCFEDPTDPATARRC